MKITAYDMPGSHRTGGLDSNLSVKQISEVLGFKPNVQDDPYKVKNSWGFKVDGVACGIWDYKNERWSTYGPRKVFVKLFGNNATY